MDSVDLLITIVALTILVTLTLVGITYAVRKLRSSGQPREEVELEGDHRFFVRHLPPTENENSEAGVAEV